jgi:hypothetical protein
LELINPKRSFVCEAAFTELNKKRQVDKTLQLFLFNDCLLVCEPLKGAATKIHHATRAGTRATSPCLLPPPSRPCTNLPPPAAATARTSVRLQGPLYAFKQFFRLHEVVFKDISDSSRTLPSLPHARTHLAEE